MELKLKNQTIKIDATECFWVMIDSLTDKSPIDEDEIKNEKGVYIFFNHDDVPIRIGKAVKLRNRILSYYSSIQKEPQKLFEKMSSEIAYVSVCYTKQQSNLELILLDFYKPKFNKNDLSSFD